MKTEEKVLFWRVDVGLDVAIWVFGSLEVSKARLMDGYI
jgi:hypothetical protein